MEGWCRLPEICLTCRYVRRWIGQLVGCCPEYDTYLLGLFLGVLGPMYFCYSVSS